MFDEPNERPERPQDPAAKANEKSDEFRIHAQLAAVFEGPRKFDAALRDLDPALGRDIQRAVGRLEKAKSPDSPILPQPSASEAADLLKLPAAKDLSTNDYYVSRRPGEVLIVRWLAGGEEADAFYGRLQAHFDAALEGYREEERQTQEWKQDPKTLAYLAALDALDVKMADRYLRNEIRKHNLFVLSTQTADELDILYLCDYVMGVEPAALVGAASAPPDEPTERDRAWFFKLFSLRGMVEGQERMCFFTFLQKAEDTFESGW